MISSTSSFILLSIHWLYRPILSYLLRFGRGEREILTSQFLEVNKILQNAIEYARLFNSSHEHITIRHYLSNFSVLRLLEVALWTFRSEFFISDCLSLLTTQLFLFFLDSVPWKVENSAILFTVTSFVMIITNFIVINSSNTSELTQSVNLAHIWIYSYHSAFECTFWKTLTITTKNPFVIYGQDVWQHFCLALQVL